MPLKCIVSGCLVDRHHRQVRGQGRPARECTLTWAPKYKVKLFFGEIAASGQPQCAKEYPDMLRRLETSSAVLGWTAWGGGAWWAYDYMFRLQSRTTTPTAHMKLLLASMP